MKTTTFFLALWLLPLSIGAQVTVQLTVLDGFGYTICDDVFSEPDEGWGLQVEGQDTVIFDGVNYCNYPSLPFVQFEQTYPTQLDVPDALHVLFIAYEQDPGGVLISNCLNLSCVEHIELDLAVPPPGQSQEYFLEIPMDGRRSWGWTRLEISTSGEPGPFFQLCRQKEVFAMDEESPSDGFRMLETDDGLLVVGGRRGLTAALWKTTPKGEVLNLKDLGNEIGGTSSEVGALLPHPDGGFVVGGTCTGCVAQDTLQKVFLLRTDADFNVDTTVGVRYFGQHQNEGTGRRTYPFLLALPNNTFLLASTLQLNLPLNAQDLILQAFDYTFMEAWNARVHTGFFESVVGGATWSQGMSLAVRRPFHAEDMVLGMNLFGTELWRREFPSVQVHSLAYLPASDRLFLSAGKKEGSVPNRLMVYAIQPGDGQMPDSLQLPQLYGQVLGSDLNPLEPNKLLLGAAVKIPTSADPTSGQIIQLEVGPLKTVSFITFTASNLQQNFHPRDVQPLSCDGEVFAITGHETLGSVPHMMLGGRAACSFIEASQTTLCSGQSVELSLPFSSNVEIQWSTGQTEPTIEVTSGGTYSVWVQTDCYRIYDAITLEEEVPAPVETSDQFCQGDTYTLPNGVVVDHPGTYEVVLTGWQGCDSIVQVSLSYYPPAQATFQAALCPGEFIEINGTIYDQDNPTGVEVLEGAAANGCDSTVTVELTFLQESILQYMAALCPMDTLFINGTPYHAGHLEGTEIISGGNWQGCDSIIIVNLSLAPQPEVVSVEVVHDDGSGSGSISVVVDGGTPPYQYFWSNGATEPAIEGLTAGTYALVVEDANGCQVFYTFQVEMVSATAEADKVDELRVFPNPVGAARRLNVQWSFSEEVQLFLADARGVLVRRQTALNDAVLDLEGLPSGTYVLVLSWDGVPLARRRILLLAQ